MADGAALPEAWAHIPALPLLNPPEFPLCFVCGPDNPHGLHLRVHRDGEDAVAVHIPPPHQQGYPGRVHGGLAGMLVDELLVYAGVPHGLWGMTARVTYRLRAPLEPDLPMLVRGTLLSRSTGGFKARVTITRPDGVCAVEGEGTCVRWDGRMVP
ncbi:MAG: hypothetical protein U0Y82_02075 [Thermoleophilia bacterium]